MEMQLSQRKRKRLERERSRSPPQRRDLVRPSTKKDATHDEVDPPDDEPALCDPGLVGPDDEGERLGRELDGLAQMAGPLLPELSFLLSDEVCRRLEQVRC